MNKLTFIIMILIALTSYAKPKRAPSQSMGDRISSEFGLDRFEKTCEVIISGESIKPRTTSYYDELNKEACLSRAKNFLMAHSKKYSQALVKHKDLDINTIIKRKVKDQKKNL